jgi:bacillithiol system protein YtxJ
MNWIDLSSVEQLETLKIESHKNPIIIFKHSTRCSISDMVKNRFERSWIDSKIPCYYLDLIQFRNVSNAVSDIFKLEHESPQLLLIHNGECVYNASHSDIRTASIESALQKIN